MKAITLHQPWATLVVIGAKHYETRSWGTPYRGQIAIHAGKTNALSSIVDERDLNPIIRRALERKGIDWRRMPTGAVLGVATVVDCALMTADMISWVAMSERAVGDWRPGRYAWRFDGVVLFDEPIPARGAQGLWEWQQP